MAKQPFVLGVIIARQGSKGVPGKNVAKIGRRMLLELAILSATKAKTISRVILSTDSPQMAAIGKKCGADVPFLRPKHLAQDKTHTPPVIEHAVRFVEKEEGRKVDIVVTLQPTSPFRKAEHIDAAIRLLLKDPRLDSAVTVKKAFFPPFWMFRAKNNTLVPLVQDGVDYSLKERQQLPLIYQPNGAVFASRRELLMKKGVLFSAFSGGKTGFSEMDSLSSIDIDHAIDLVMAKTVLKDHPELLKDS